MTASPVLSPAAGVPAPRVAPEAARPARRERPASQYWDVAEARWRTAR